MNKEDLDSIIPKSNADTSSSEDEYEIVEDEPANDPLDDKPSKSKKSSMKVSSKQKIRSKKPKTSARKMHDGQLPPLQTDDPSAHAMEAPKPILIKQKLDQAFDKQHQLDLSKDTQNGIAYKEEPSVTSDKEGFDEPIYKRKSFQITAICIVSVILMICIFMYCRWRYMMKYDPIVQPSASISGGHKSKDDSSSSSSSSSSDDEPPQNLNELSSTTMYEKKLPASYENSFYDEDYVENEKIADSALNNLPKGSKKDKDKSGAKKDKKDKDKSGSKKDKKKELPKRDKHGRFVKS